MAVTGVIIKQLTQYSCGSYRHGNEAAHHKWLLQVSCSTDLASLVSLPAAATLILLAYANLSAVSTFFCFIIIPIVLVDEKLILNFMLVVVLVKTSISPNHRITYE